MTERMLPTNAGSMPIESHWFYWSLPRLSRPRAETSVRLHGRGWNPKKRAVDEGPHGSRGLASENPLTAPATDLAGVVPLEALLRALHCAPLTLSRKNPGLLSKTDPPSAPTRE